MVVMGRIAGAFGVKGWVRVQPFTQSVESLTSYPTWWVSEASGWQESKVEEAAVHGRIMPAAVGRINR